MTRLTSEFASRILDTLRAASLAELTARGKAPGSRAPKKVSAEKPAAKKPPAKKPAAKSVSAKKIPAKKPATKRAPAAEARLDREVRFAALSFFADRGSKGATAHQLGVHLTELGLGSKADVIGSLATEGVIRDAGFRRSTGTGNKTATVYVSGP